MFVVFMRKLLLADSIPKHVGPLAGVKLYVLRGAYIEDFTAGITSGEIAVKDYDAVLVHVGTNNIARDNSAQLLLGEMGNLLGAIRWERADIHIVVSGVVPRLVDQAVTEQTVKSVNKLLSKVTRERNVIFIRSFSPFCCARESTGLKTWLFGRDGLHLSDKGSRVLHHLFKVQFSDKNILQRQGALRLEEEEKMVRELKFGYF
jgi:lysophospholipase L1-like esterase